MEAEKHQEQVRQTTITLSYFDYEIPALYVNDDDTYIPVVELCKMLGLRPDTHIPRWRRLLLWDGARKLLYQAAKRGKRWVWCLHGGSLLFWFSCFVGHLCLQNDVSSLNRQPMQE